MSDPVIIIDTNVLADVSRGNKPLADALNAYVRTGRTVYIAAAAYEELVTRAPTPQMGGQYREMLKDLHIDKAPPGSQAARLEFLADNIIRVPGPGQPGQIREYDRKNDPNRQGDAFVASQAKALDGELWTLDAKFQGRAEALGVKLVPECKTIKGVTGLEDPVRGRQLLGLNPKAVGMNGQVIPPPPNGSAPGSYTPTIKPPGSGGGKPGGGGGSGNSGGGSPGGASPAGTGGGRTGSGGPGGSGAAPNAGSASVGIGVGPSIGSPQPSARGTAIIGGIQLAFQGINLTLNFINDRIQKERVEKAFESLRPVLTKTRSDNPRLGILLLFYYRQVEALPDSIIQPGAVFESIGYGKGVTRDEALRDYNSVPTISAGVGPNERRFFQEVWIEPLVKTTITTAKCPFPPVAIGRFWLKGRKATFQRVEFNPLSGFDDICEKSLELPNGVNPEFVVLKPSTEVYWFNLNGRQKTDVPLKTANTANGNSITVVDLDPYSPFHAAAAMCFPVDDLTEEVFKLVESTQGAAILALINFSMIRWIRAENIHLLRFL